MKFNREQSQLLNVKQIQYLIPMLQSHKPNEKKKEKFLSPHTFLHRSWKHSSPRAIPSFSSIWCQYSHPRFTSKSSM